MEEKSVLSNFTNRWNEYHRKFQTYQPFVLKNNVGRRTSVPQKCNIIQKSTLADHLECSSIQ
jgi:hypothetical protein